MGYFVIAGAAIVLSTDILPGSIIAYFNYSPEGEKKN